MESNIKHLKASTEMICAVVFDKEFEGREQEFIDLNKEQILHEMKRAAANIKLEDIKFEIVN